MTIIVLDIWQITMRCNAQMMRRRETDRKETGEMNALSVVAISVLVVNCHLVSWGLWVGWQNTAFDKIGYDTHTHTHAYIHISRGNDVIFNIAILINQNVNVCDRCQSTHLCCYHLEANKDFHWRARVHCVAHRLRPDPASPRILPPPGWPCRNCKDKVTHMSQGYAYTIMGYFIAKCF